LRQIADSPVTYQEVLVRPRESTDYRRSVAELARDFEQPPQELAAAMCGNAPDGHDLVHETFERVARTRPAQLPRLNRSAWLFTVLRRLFFDKYRRQVRAPQRVDLDLEPVAVAFRTHALEGKSYGDIAPILGVAVNTVGTRILRARHKLRVVLGERLFERDRSTARRCFA
jgi:RNA polymerase sigma-70 factor, ECF subfamily